MDKSFFIQEERLNLLFNYMDTDHSGYIDPHDIYKIYKRFGKELPMLVVNRMVEESDFKNEGRISYDDFKRVMKNESALKQKRRVALIDKEKFTINVVNEEINRDDTISISMLEDEDNKNIKNSQTPPFHISKIIKPKSQRKIPQGIQNINTKDFGK